MVKTLLDCTQGSLLTLLFPLVIETQLKSFDAHIPICSAFLDVRKACTSLGPPPAPSWFHILYQSPVSPSLLPLVNGLTSLPAHSELPSLGLIHHHAIHPLACHKHLPPAHSSSSYNGIPKIHLPPSSTLILYVDDIPHYLPFFTCLHTIWHFSFIISRLLTVNERKSKYLIISHQRPASFSSLPTLKLNNTLFVLTRCRFPKIPRIYYYTKSFLVPAHQICLLQTKKSCWNHFTALYKYSSSSTLQNISCPPDPSSHLLLFSTPLFSQLSSSGIWLFSTSLSKFASINSPAIITHFSPVSSSLPLHTGVLNAT